MASSITVITGTDRSTHSLYFQIGNGRRVRVDRLPTTISYSEAANIGVSERQGRKPVTRIVGPSLRTLSFTTVVGNRNNSREWDCEADLDALLYIARTGWAFRISGAASRFEQNTWWQAIGCTMTITHRTSQNKASRAEIEWELQEYVGDDVTVTRAIPKKATKTTAKKASSKSAKSVARTYVVRSGDSLWKIAAKLLGRGDRWKEIYNLNKSTVRNPNVIRAGMKLKVPAK